MSKIQSKNAVDAKDTIYVDVDDEITGIIDKVRSSSGKVVALVLPKRATVLQSIVNMKLLKRTAEGAKKHLVLVTSEASLLPLAGSVGLHVAATPTSKPIIPPAPDSPSDEPEDIDEPLAVNDGTADDDLADEEFDAKADGNKPIGALAAAGAAGVATSKLSPAIDEEIDMDDSGEPVEAASDKDSKAGKPKKNRKLAVPNFDNFRTKLILAAGVLVLLIVGWIFAFVVLPKATITVSTDTTTVTTNANLTLDTAAKTLNSDQGIVPATAQTNEKSYSQQVAATGQLNNGEKAVGTVTVTNCSGVDATVSAGTAFSAGGLTYISQGTLNVPDSNYTSPATGSKCKNDGKASVGVIAAKGGTIYNTDTATYTISGKPSGLTAQGSQMSGGTDSITKIVSQADIDSAKSKISTQDASAIRQGLQAALQGKKLTAVTPTFLAGEPVTTTSAKAGETAETVTVTQVVSYSMLGVKEADLKTLVVDNVNKQIDKSKQVILEDGVDKAKFTQTNPGTAAAASVAFSAKSIAGPDIDVASLKPQVVGKKTGDIKSLLEGTPGVTSVEVKYSPFWVHSTPKNEKKITIELNKSNTGKQ